MFSWPDVRLRPAGRSQQKIEATRRGDTDLRIADRDGAATDGGAARPGAHLTAEKVAFVRESIFSVPETTVSRTESVVSATEKTVSPTESICSATKTIISPTKSIRSETESIVSATRRPTPRQSESSPRQRKLFPRQSRSSPRRRKPSQCSGCLFSLFSLCSPGTFKARGPQSHG